MGFNFNMSFGNAVQQPITVERNTVGDWFYTIFSNFSNREKTIPDSEKVNAVLTNPALLKVISLDCDVFSMGKINKYNEGKLLEQDFLYSISKSPNLRQSWTQFFWDYKFYLDIFGVAILYNPSNSKVLDENKHIVWLDPSKIEWNETVLKRLRGFIFSNVTLKEVLKGVVKYRLDNGQTISIQLNEMHTFYDLTNCVSNNPLTGVSRIDALYKIIINSQMALDAKGINLEFAQKFLVSGQTSLDNINELSMSGTEKSDIEASIRSNKNVHATKSKVLIERFVDNIANLKLDESFYSDFFMFGSMYNIPRDILETSLRGATYENQEKAMARFIEYAQSPKGQKITDWLEMQYNLQDIRMSWKHLMFSQVFEKDKAEKIGLEIDNITKALTVGALTDAEAKKMINNLLNV